MLLVIFLTTTSSLGFSQDNGVIPGPPDAHGQEIMLAGGPGDPGCEPLDPACPIDGGLSALLAIGAGYGIKKIRDARKTMDPE